MLGSGEELLIGTNAVHPKLALSIGSLASIFIGALAGSALQAATGWGPESIGPFLGAMGALVGRWLYIFRSTSELQPAGAIPLIGLTNQRLVFIETDVWGRATGTTHPFPISEVSEMALKRKPAGLSDTVLKTADDRVIQYRIRYADRIKEEIDRLQAES
ncbi:MAG: hypothetical protein HKN80_02160 [Acidimicrobiia bacterium]|nr:hypothetical protein [Acidimicrobiia bacterium]